MVTTGVLLATPLGPTVSTTPASSTSSVTQPIISVWRTDRRPQSFEEAQQSGEASSIYREGSQTVSRTTTVNDLSVAHLALQAKTCCRLAV
ncbi:hypothetical protein C1H46_000264 [Malus baccata]|uniref:Uncharacterized protein n=1 Tax=Malus baccata TaxID=106549 RepID=A0A540NTQ6_MALBA|nr:hypothetical protein C1H46_000264 [Malus baccata]